MSSSIVIGKPSMSNFDRHWNTEIIFDWSKAVRLEKALSYRYFRAKRSLISSPKKWLLELVHFAQAKDF